MIKERGYRSIELGGHSFTLEWADEESGFLINLICQDIPNSNLLTPDSIFRLHTNNSKTKVTIFFGNRCIYRGINRIHGLNIIISTMLQQLELLCTNGIFLRAALVSLNGKGAIIIGKAGSGKTSLASALILSGWSYHGDQVVFIADDELICESLATPLLFKDNWKLPTCNDSLSDIQASEYNGQTILSVSDLLPDCISNKNSVVPEILIVSHFESGASISITPLRAGLAAFHFINSILNKKKFNQSGLNKVGQVIKSLRSFELVYGNFEQLSSLNMLFSEYDELKPS